jgi:hypothetical protein
VGHPRTTPGEGRRRATVATFAALAAASAAVASPTTPGTLRSYSTIRSLGVEWSITGDADHDAKVTVQYRKSGSSSFKPALDLVRVDYGGFNMLAGSVLFLDPGSVYEVKLDLSDPDGGAASQTVSIATRPIPAKPAGGRILHVVPGSGSGDGSEQNPFRGIAAAQSQAVPGDTFLVHAGNYGSGVELTKAGTAQSYIVWQGAGDGEATFPGLEISASHVWVEGLTVRDQEYGLTVSSSPQNVVVSRCQFYDNHKAIYLGGDAAYWYIVDNVIVGDIPPEEILDGSFGGEGIELNHTSGHTVAYNSITLAADGISYAHENVDIHNNDIFNTSDDGIEPDYGYANIRMWENRVHFPTNNGLSFQPMNSAPWYLIRNQVIIATDEGPLKLKTTDRFVLMHNTLVNVEPGEFQNNEEHMVNAISRNNLFVAAAGADMWQIDDPADWQTDLDYDGFDWGTYTGSPFEYLGDGYASVAAFAAASGQEVHGRRVFKDQCFETLNFTGPPPLLTLKAGCGAVDTGEIIPNINDGWVGSAPDLGAYERGATALHFGPREGGPSVPPSNPPPPPTGLRAE